MIETASQSVRSNAKGPRGHGYETGSADELPMVGNDPYPRLGSAFTASKNAKLIPEYSIENPTAMAAGLINGAPATTMKFRFADGSPFMYTINGLTASDWVMRRNDFAPSGYAWEPLP